MFPALRRAVNRFLPAHFHDPLGLARRLVRSGHPAARFAMAAALGGVIAWPLDRLLEPFERRRYRRAPRPSRPLVLVCGAPRSGTTIVALTLIRYLPVAYFPNLTSLFPRAPLTAMALFGGVLPPERRPLENYYGRTAGLGGPNDALYVWDRWLGPDRMTVPSRLSPEQIAAMRRFVGAAEAFFGCPLVAKNNALHASAHLVAEALPEARFLCLEREPVALAQSLLRARLEIHGADTIAYGLSAPGARYAAADRVLESVARQVVFHERIAAAQRARLGPDRFRTISYEEFCAAPAPLVRDVGAGMLGLDPSAMMEGPAPYPVSRRPYLPPDAADRLAEWLDRVRAESSPSSVSGT
jgi:hypothetical protein